MFLYFLANSSRPFEKMLLRSQTIENSGKNQKVKETKSHITRIAKTPLFEATRLHNVFDCPFHARTPLDDEGIYVDIHKALVIN